MNPKVVTQKGVNTNLENTMNNNSFDSNIQLGDQNTEVAQSYDINEDIQRETIVTL